MFQACRIATILLDLRLPSHLRHMHKFAYAEFVQDGGRQLKFRECYCDIPSQLYAVERQKYEIRYSMGKPDKSGE